MVRKGRRLVANNVWRLFRFDLGRLMANVMSIIHHAGPRSRALAVRLVQHHRLLERLRQHGQPPRWPWPAPARATRALPHPAAHQYPGGQVVSALRANDQIDWHITDEEDAIDGAKSGRYYAAVVIPKSFSRDMLTFYTGDAGHADIVYYANEKKSAIAPKITDQGSRHGVYQVNAVFAQTLSRGVALAGRIAFQLRTTRGRLGRPHRGGGPIMCARWPMPSTTRRGAFALRLARSLLRGSLAPFRLTAMPGLHGSGRDAVRRDGAGRRGAGHGGRSEDLGGYAPELAGRQRRRLRGGIRFRSSRCSMRPPAAARALPATCARRPTRLRPMRRLYRQVADGLEGAAPSLPSLRPQSDRLGRPRARAVASQADSMAASLRTAADKLGRATPIFPPSAMPRRPRQRGRRLRQFHQDDCEAHVAPGARLAGRAGRLHGRCALRRFRRPEGRRRQLSSSGHLGGRCRGWHRRYKIAETTEKLQERLLGAAGDWPPISTAPSPRATATPCARLLGSDDVRPFRRRWRAPWASERIAVFPVENFGSAMAPLYTTLALFIGSLLILVVFKAKARYHASRKEAGLVSPKPQQLFFGRFAVMAVVSLAQSTVMALGNLFFLDVQVTSPWLFMVCFWGAGLVFHVHHLRAGGVLRQPRQEPSRCFCSSVQVTGCGGSFPLQIMPDFVQALSPWLPATHVVNAMRSAMMGTYGGDFWAQMGALALFLIPAALLGLVLRKPLEKFVEWYVEKVGELEAHQASARCAMKRPPFLILPLFGGECRFDPEMASQMPVEGRNGRKNSGMLPKNRPFRG
ncbi:MAG: YhgE/Pip domain-containing protein [Adlercreutzia equolifaciens]